MSPAPTLASRSARSRDFQWLTALRDGATPIGLNNTAIIGGDFGGAYARGTNMFNFSVGGAISFDMRQQTEYGTLRSYVDIGVRNSTNPGGYGGPYVFNPLFPSASFGGSNAYSDRAFIQFAGFTAGRIRSFFDLERVEDVAQ